MRPKRAKSGPFPWKLYDNGDGGEAMKQNRLKPTIFTL